MLSEKLAKTLSEKQLKQLIKMQGAKANKNLRGIKAANVENLSGAYVTKTAPYLQKHGTSRGAFRVRYGKNESKDNLIQALLNIQYFNEKIGSAEKVKERAQETADKFGIDIEDTQAYWRLVRYGFNSVGYRIDSDSIMKIVAERMRHRQTERGIKSAITRAANLAENGDDYLTHFSQGGKWL